MDNSTLITSLLTEVESFDDILPVYWPNIKPDDGYPDSAHIRLDILMAKADTIGLSSTHKKHGILKFRVFYPKGHGVVRPTAEADKILAHFPRGTTLSGIRVDEEGYVSPPIDDGVWYVTPVTVPFYKLES